MRTIMLTDRYGLPLSTTSSAARDAYVEGCEAKLTMYPGAIEVRSVREENRLAFSAVMEAFLARYLGGSVEPVGDAFRGLHDQV
jgi:hypothetical protein